MTIPQQRVCCYHPPPLPHWNFCPRCGLPLRMACPVCGDAELIDLVQGGLSPWECRSPRPDLLKHCPDCGKLFKMDAHRCDQPGCRGTLLEVPPSTWADAHGGVQRRRIVNVAAGRLVEDPTEEVTVWPMILGHDIGDTLVSAYGRLYLDSDPNVQSYRGINQMVGDPFQAFPRAEPTAVLAHSGYLAVLGQRQTFLLDANEPVDLARLDWPAHAQMIADEDWWLIGEAGIARLSLNDAVAGKDPVVILAEDFSRALAPVRLAEGQPWLMMSDGRHFVVIPSDEVRELPQLPPEEEHFAAFASNGYAVSLANRQGNAGGVVRIWSIPGLIAGEEPETIHLEFPLTHTWCAHDEMAFVCATSGDLIQPIRLDSPQFRVDALRLPPATGLQEIVWLDETPGLLLFKTADGRFTLLDPDPRSQRRTPWNIAWNGGRPKSWVVWGEAIVAVMEKPEGCRLVTIPRKRQE